MDCSHSEVIDAPLFKKLLPDQIQITELLNSIIIQTQFDLVADAFKITPASLNRQCVVKCKLFVNHTHRVVCPHMIPSKLVKLAHSCMDITIAHMTI